MGKFCFHDRFSEGMGIVALFVDGTFDGAPAPQLSNVRLLDIPAGAGRLSDYFRGKGYDVTSADINSARNNYVLADMTKDLPFKAGEFDIVVSMEGIEHILDPNKFVSELVRVTKPGGMIILTTPNISCFFSRWTFFCTGNFFQFWPAQCRHNRNREPLFDLGHVTPLTWQQMAFLFEHHGASLERVKGNKVKRKVLLPLFLPFMILGYFWLKLSGMSAMKPGKWQGRPKDREYYRNIYRLSTCWPALLSRNIILVLKKNG